MASIATGLSRRMFTMQPVALYRRCSRVWPLPVAFATCYTNASLADMFAQKVVEKKHEVDLRRNVGFGLWGGAYLGCVQYVVYNIVMTAMFGASTTILNGVRKTLFELCVHGPMFCLPCFYFSQDLLMTGSFRGHLRYYGEFWDIYRPYFCTWSWFMLMVFTVIPMELRIASMAGMSFCWSVVLSTIANRSVVSKDSSAASQMWDGVTVEARAVLDLDMSSPTILPLPIASAVV